MPTSKNKHKLLNFVNKNLTEVGCDEAGRGCLAGPVVAAAVILKKDFYHPLLNDSKKTTEKQRKQLRKFIEDEAISFGIGIVEASEIDEINILNASFLAMHRAIDKMSIVPGHILVDGNRFNKYKDIPHTCIIKGDSKYTPIAAASILAKTERDEIMQELAKVHSNYQWEKNKGYPTQAHRSNIEKHGICEQHRKSFKLLPDLKFEF